MAAALKAVEDAITEGIEADATEMRVQFTAHKDHVEHCESYRKGVPCIDCRPWLVLRKWLLGIWAQA